MNKHIAPHIKAVFFDHDDTLYATFGPKSAEHKFIAKKYYDIDLTDAEIKKHWGIALHELYKVLYQTDDVEQAIEYNKKHHQDFPKIMFDGTVDVFNALHDAGIKTGIITATSRFSFEHDLSVSKFPKSIIDYTQTQDDTAHHKPDPKVFEPAVAWLKQHNVKPSEVLYVGDGMRDMQAALGAGFEFVGVQTGFVTAEESAAAGAKSVVSISHLK